MKRLLCTFLALVVFGVVSLGLIQPVRAAPSDVDLLKQGVAAWEKGWSPGDSLFLMNQVDRLYERSDRFREFDTLSPTGTIAQSYQSFKDLWEPTMQAATHATTVVDDNVEVITDGKMGLTTFTFQTGFTDRKTGKKYAEHAHASMVWEKHGDRWVIVHEHVSSPVRIN